MSDTSSLETDTLARTIWGEARGEGIPGMWAVGHVVKNRVARGGWWGNDIVAVCTKPYQFSCWLASDPNLPKLQRVDETDPGFATARVIARSLLSGHYFPDPTNGADSYYADHIAKPDWAVGKEPVAIIGHHRFYKTRP